MPTINIADKETLDSVNSKIDTINTNAGRLTSARATKIDNIGSTGDTGGSTTAGTIMGKLNAILSSSGGGGSSNIGSTGDTGGSTTAGTVMAKLNALLTSWTSTRAGYVDNIRSYTITNNTENKTGVLSQKLSYLINRLGKTVLASNTVIKTLSSSGTVTVNANSSDLSTTAYSSYTSYSTVMATGIYRISATGSTTIDKVYDSGAGINKVVVQIEHQSVSSSGVTTHTFTLISSESAASSTTKYLDIPLAAGDKFRCRFACSNTGYTDNCSFAYQGDDYTFTWTDISVRGTVQEATSSGVLI